MRRGGSRRASAGFWQPPPMSTDERIASARAFFARCASASENTRSSIACRARASESSLPMPGISRHSRFALSVFCSSVRWPCTAGLRLTRLASLTAV